MTRNPITILQDMAAGLAMAAEAEALIVDAYAPLLKSPMTSDDMDARRRVIYLDARSNRRRWLEQEAAINTVLKMVEITPPPKRTQAEIRAIVERASKGISA